MAADKSPEQPCTQPNSNQNGPSAKDKPQHITTAGAQSQSNSELARALAHSQSHNPVQSNARKAQCQPGKNTKESHTQSARREALVNALVERYDLGHGLF